MLARQLFTFVTAAPIAAPQGDPKPVAGTNNEAERTLRSAAQARQTGRTSKTLRGARRQTILSSVLESLRNQLPTFTLASVIDEVLRWSHTGLSCFAELLGQLQLKPPNRSVLDDVLPLPAR
jgi:transposase